MNFDPSLHENPFDALALSVARRLGVLPEAAVTSRRRVDLPTADAEGVQPGYWGKVLLVSSARPREGKSFVVGRLARRLAAAGAAQVAVIDGNASHPSLHAGFKVPQAGYGFFDCVAEGCVLDGQLTRSPVNRIEVMPTRAGARQSMLLRVASVRQVLDGFRARFAVTIIDAAVLGRTGCLTQLADATLLVVDASRTRADLVTRALAADHVDRVRVIGVVLNRRPDPLPAWLSRRLS